VPPSKLAGANASAPPWPTFTFNLEHELWTLQEELSTKTYRPGAYRSFSIDEPKLEALGPHTHPPVSILYLSVDVTPVDSTGGEKVMVSSGSLRGGVVSRFNAR
jgi:hypothetical protein